MVIANWEGRFGGGRVNDHDLIELVRCLERAEIALNGVDGLERGTGQPNVGPVGKSGDRSIGTIDDSRANVARPRFEVVGTRRQCLLVEHARSAV